MKKHTQKRVRVHPLLLSFQFVLAEVCFIMLIFCFVLTVNRSNNLETEAAQLHTLTWNSVTYRHQVCLAGTSQCQPFKTTTGTSAAWTLASLVNYDFHVDISSNGSTWYGWDHQTNKGKNCFGPATCNYTFTWPKVDYKVSTTIDGNVEHVVTQPATSYTYSNVGYGVGFTGVVKFNDLGNFGASRVHTNLTGTTAAQNWVLSAPEINGGDVNFKFVPNIGTGASLIVRNSANQVVHDSGALTPNSSGYFWANAPAGTYKAVLFYYPKAISNEISVRVDRKAVMQFVEPKCGNTGWPNNVVVRHGWEPAEGSFSAQRLQISTNQNFSSNLQEKTISSSTRTYELSGYGADRAYYARIKSVTTDGKTIYSRKQGFNTIDCPNTGLEIPLPTSVSGLPACVNSGSTYGSGITLNWNTVSGATNYTARFTKGNVTSGDYAIKTVSGNSAGGSGSWNTGGNPLVTWVSGGNLNLQPGETYYFAVSAQNGSVNSGYNLTGRSLQVGPVPVCSAAVVPPTPTGVDGVPICVPKDTTFGGNLNFKWTSIDGASSYTVRLTNNVNTGGDYAIKTVNTNSAGGNGSWNPGGNPLVTWVDGGSLAMKPGVKYFYTVKATVNGVDTGYDLTGKSMQVGPVYYCVGEGEDSDGDGFSDSVESYIGTNINEKCGPGAFPPDINDNGAVNSGDQLQLSFSVVSSEGQEKYNKRRDLNADKAVNSGDQLILARYVGKNCQTLGVKTEGEVKAVATPSNMRTSTPPFADICSETITYIFATWDGVGDYWVDFTWDNWQTTVHKEVKNSSGTGIPGGYTFYPGEADASWYVIFPGREYKWRLWNGSKYYPNVDGQVFKMPTCPAEGIPAESEEIHDYIYGLGYYRFTDLPPGDGRKVLERVELGRFLWGLAGCESGWNQNNNSSPTFKGLYQFLPDTWYGYDLNGDGVRETGGILRSMGENPNTSIFDGFAQTRAVIHNINSSRSTPNPWDPATGRLTMFSSQWPHCSFHWNNPKDMAYW